MSYELGVWMNEKKKKKMLRIPEIREKWSMLDL